MTFTRDDIAAYEAAKPTAPAPVEPETKPETQATAEDSSAPEVTEPADLVEDGSSSEDVTAESSAAPAEDPEGDTLEDKPAKGNAARERIEELIIERNAIRKYAEYMLSEAEKWKAAANPTKPAASAEESASEKDKPPSLDDEDIQYDPIAFAKKQNEWIQKQVAKRVDEGVAQALAKQAVQQEQASMRQNFQSKVDEFKKAHSDFDTVISNPNLPDLSASTARLILKSETGPAVAYHLAKNPDIAARISRLDNEEQARAIGRIEAQLSVAPVVKPSASRTVSKAPPPPKPIPAGSGNVQKNLSDMSIEEFVAHEREQKIKQRENRRRARGAMR